MYTEYSSKSKTPAPCDAPPAPAPIGAFLILAGTGGGNLGESASPVFPVGPLSTADPAPEGPGTLLLCEYMHCLCYVLCIIPYIVQYMV